LKAIIYPITEAAPNRLAIVARPRGNDWLCEEISALSREGIEILVSMLTDEEANELGLNQELAECDAAGINFVNVAIPDRSVPSDRSDFLQHVEQLAEMVQKGRFVGVHCRASIGRSSILVVSLCSYATWMERRRRVSCCRVGTWLLDSRHDRTTGMGSREYSRATLNRNCCNIAISRFDPDFGEEKAQSCDIACYQDIAWEFICLK
jgi:hypothetical protein